MALSYAVLSRQKDTRSNWRRKRHCSLVDIGPQGKKWAKGIFAPDSGEVSNQAIFVWPDDSGSFDLHEVFEKHQQRQIEEAVV